VKSLRTSRPGRFAPGCRCRFRRHPWGKMVRGPSMYEMEGPRESRDTSVPIARCPVLLDNHLSREPRRQLRFFRCVPRPGVASSSRRTPVSQCFRRPGVSSGSAPVPGGVGQCLVPIPLRHKGFRNFSQEFSLSPGCPQHHPQLSPANPVVVHRLSTDPSTALVVGVRGAGAGRRLRGRTARARLRCGWPGRPRRSGPGRPAWRPHWRHGPAPGRCGGLCAGCPRP